MRIKISTSAYNEIATALERLGVKADGTTELTLEKDTQLSCSIDFKMVTIRRDIASIAASCYKDACRENEMIQSVEVINSGGAFQRKALTFPEFCNQLMNWILSEEKPNPYAHDTTKG